MATRNNNPGNLVYAKQEGAVKDEKSNFAKFSTPEQGFKALQNQINLDSSRGLGLASFITKYAPSGENDTKSYIKHMIIELKPLMPNITQESKLSDIVATVGVQQVAAVMSKKEDINYFNNNIRQLLVKKDPAVTVNKPKSQPVKLTPAKPVPVKKEEPSIFDEVKSGVETAADYLTKNIESIPSMVQRAATKVDFLPVIKGFNDGSQETTIMNKPVEKVETKVVKNKEVVVPKFKILGETKEGYQSFINVFDRQEGFRYIPTSRVESHNKYNNTNGMAHFLFDYDLTSEKAADNSNTNYFHKNFVKYDAEGNIDKKLLSKRKAYQPGSKVKNNYFSVYTKQPDGSVIMKYKKADEMIKGDKVADDLRQYRYTDINWNGETQAVNFNKTIKTLPTKTGEPTYLIYAKAYGKGAYGKFGGGSVVFLVDNRNIAIDFAGSITQIKNQADEIIKEYKLNPNDLIIAYHDLGSYSAKPKSRNGVIDNGTYYNFNTNKQTGAGLAFPKQ